MDASKEELFPRSVIPKKEVTNAEIATMMEALMRQTREIIDRQSALQDRAAEQEAHEGAVDVHHIQASDHLSVIARAQRAQEQAMMEGFHNLRTDMRSEIASIGESIRGELGLVRREVQSGNESLRSDVQIGNEAIQGQVADVGRNVSSGFSRMDQGFAAMNTQFRELNDTIKRYSNAPRHACFEALNFDNIPRTIIKFLKCLLALYVFLLTLARLAIDILLQFRKLFYGAVQDATKVFRPIPFDTVIKVAIGLVELNFYLFFMDTVGNFFGVKRLDKRMIEKSAMLTVKGLNFMYREVLRTASESRLSEGLGIVRTAANRSDPVIALCKNIEDLKAWYYDYQIGIQTKLSEKAADLVEKAASAASQATYEKLSNTTSKIAEATGLKTAANAAASAAAAAAKYVGYSGGGELQHITNLFGYLDKYGHGHPKYVHSMITVIGYLERNSLNPNKELIEMVSSPVVQERMHLIQQRCIALFPPKKGGRQRKRTRRIKIRSKRYN